jgi:hypothetical protein
MQPFCPSDVRAALHGAAVDKVLPAEAARGSLEQGDVMNFPIVCGHAPRTPARKVSGTKVSMAIAFLFSG